MTAIDVYIFGARADTWCMEIVVKQYSPTLTAGQQVWIHWHGKLVPVTVVSDDGTVVTVV